MGDAMLAGPQAQEQLPVACDDIDESILRLIDEWTARKTELYYVNGRRGTLLDG